MVENNRKNGIERLRETEERHHQNPTDKELAVEYAETLFQLGNFSKAQEVLNLLITDQEVNPQIFNFLAQIEYLQGNYEQSEMHYNILSQFSDFKEKAELGLLLIYYQKNEYQKANNLLADITTMPLRDMMMAVGNKKPYQIEWNDNQEVIVPFIVTDPLPVVSIEINEKKVNVLIDTGAAELFIDEILASELGIESVAQQAGIGGGGKNAIVNYGIVDSITISNVTIKTIPVIIAETKRYSDIYEDKEITIDGILGTKVFQQFLSTMDYPQAQLIVRPRNKASLNILKSETTQTQAVERLPFNFVYDHFIIGKLAINGNDDINFFFDSGLNNPGELLFPEETMNYFGITIPEIDTTDKVGGVGGEYSYGSFTVYTLALGKFEQKNATGLYGIFPQPLYFDLFQFYVDGLISHNFLKNYKWTIDFDSMEMIFSQ